MRNTLIFGIALVLVLVSGLPVTKQRPKEQPEEEKPPVGPDHEVLEYERYLKEVVEALESDPEFRKKLDKAPEVDVRTGKIAQELEFVSHHVRSKLDEIKRREIERLRSLATKQYELSNDIDRNHLKIDSHLNSDNVHTFEIEDLKKLILKTSKDLVEADKRRREEFKQYEMQKEFEKQEKLRELDEETRKKFEQELKEKQEKHNKHEKLHHPGNKAQLEEVWEKQDHMEGQDFDPRTFFMIHDVDGNGFWDETELKALFVKELDKIYQEGLPEDDLRERAEEMERMREHVMKESDVNHDGLISFQEFLDQTKRDEFQHDPGWDTVDNEPQFTHEEYLQFERNRQEEIQRLIAQGALPPHPNMPHGYYPDGGYQHDPNGAPINYHPNQQYQAQPHYQQQQQQAYQQQQHHQQQQQQQKQQHYQQPQYQHQPQYNQQQQYNPNVAPQQPGQQKMPPPNYQQPSKPHDQPQQPPNAHVQGAPVVNNAIPLVQHNSQVPQPAAGQPNPAQNVPQAQNPNPNQAGSNQVNIPKPAVVKPVESNAIH